MVLASARRLRNISRLACAVDVLGVLLPFLWFLVQVRPPLAVEDPQG